MQVKETVVKPLFTQLSFAMQVETLVRVDSLTYVEAIMHICEQHELDPTDINGLISKPLKAKLQSEGMDRNIIPDNRAGQAMVRFE